MAGLPEPRDATVLQKPKLREWMPAVAWMSVIFATSCTVVTSKRFVHSVATAGHVTDAGFASFWASSWWVFVKGYHALEFFLLALLLVRPMRGKVWAAGLAAVAFAATDEFHQTFVPDRGGRLSDVAIDVGGIAVALLCVHLRHRRIGRWRLRTTNTTSG